MKKDLATLIFALIIFCNSNVCAQQYLWQDTTRSLDERVEWLIGNLTPDEKLSLLVHQNPAIPRVGLPAYSWWNEALHGVARAGQATVYPMPIALAASFDPELVHSVFSNVANEARLKYHQAQDTGGTGDYSGLTFFTPNINIFRDPRWGRGMETYGEDPFLSALMGLACVEGLQGGNTAACLKHFAVHSGPEGSRHHFNSIVSERDLRSTYLPAFEYIIKNSNVQQVMCGYNRLNGEPCCTNRRLFDILRNEWHYDGILVTDCWALNDAYETDTVIPRHRTHASAALAYGDAFGREVDLECGSGLHALRQAVELGLVPESKVDEHLRRILRTRLAVTSPTSQTSQTSQTSPTSVAAQTMVLLKNNGVLPLKANDSLRLEGPNVWDTLMPLGNYNGSPLHTVSIGEALSPFTVHLSSLNVHLSSPIVIYAGGLNPQLEGEELPVEKEGFYKGDRTLIELPREQVEEIKAFKAQGYRIVLVLCTGSAFALENVIDDCDAVLVAWYGGQDMGTAVRQLLFGERDDFGRLPVTFYRSSDDLPDFSDYHMQGRTYRYADREHVEFPFGYGLSYSFHQLWGTPTVDVANFTIEGLVSQCHTDCDAPTHRTVVQVYLKNDNDPDAPVKQLIAIQSVTTVDFDHKVPFRIQLDPFWFRQYNPETNLLDEPKDGTLFTLQIGFSSDDKDLTDLPFTYHNTQHDSIPETDPAILQRIDQWQDLKFGFMLHWGIYAQWGCVESWNLCNEDWVSRERIGQDGRPVYGTNDGDYYQYKQAYQNLNSTFNPQHFAPQQWAAAAKGAGMKYVVFTTKHHDGFCMFDSKFTDYTSMGKDCPAQKDFTRGVVDAFRNHRFWIGLYFSKPDWHCDDYWAHEWATPDRNVNYSIANHPHRWQRYCNYTYNQIRELSHNYGPVDILWLDGGWVRPAWSVNDESRPWLGCSGQIQELDMQHLASIAREENPSMIIVDRSVGGRYENYRTPEKQVPDSLLPYPWETCMTLGNSWSYSPNDRYKSTRELIHMLCDVVAKGGNLLLNVGPDADGNLPAEALQRMEEIGQWLRKNGHAIYSTRPLFPYCDGTKRYTQSKDGRHQYEITLTDEAPYATVKELKGNNRK